MTESLSNRQYSFLQEAQREGGLSLRRMIQISQTTAGSVTRRGFMAWDIKTENFTLTEEGLKVMEMFEHTDVDRQDWSRPLGKWVTRSQQRRGLRNERITDSKRARASRRRAA